MIFYEVFFMKLKKKKHKTDKLPEPGTFRYGIMMRQNPIQFTKDRYEMLKRKREEKLNRDKKLKERHK